MIVCSPSGSGRRRLLPPAVRVEDGAGRSATADDGVHRAAVPAKLWLPLLAGENLFG